MEIRRSYKIEFPIKPKRSRKIKPQKPIIQNIVDQMIEPQLQPLPKTKKIKKTKTTTKDARKEQKRIEREDKNKGKLFQQLTLIHQRIERMENDKERYCLVDWQKEEGKKLYRFSMVRENEPYVLKIDVKPDYNTVCNCMDWRVRCRNQMIPCKHIYYILHRILGYELFDYFDNQIMKPEMFEQLVNAKLAAKRRTHMDDGGLEDKECPICFTDFKGYDAKLVKKCPECRCCAHEDCAKMWVLHSVKKACAICGSANWRVIVN